MLYTETVSENNLQHFTNDAHKKKLT